MGSLFGEVTIVDGAGREVPLVPHFRMMEFSRKSDRRRRLDSAREAISGRPSPQEWRRIIAYGLLQLPLFLVLALAPAIMTFKLGWPVWALAIAVIPLGMGPAVMTVWITRRVLRERIVRMMLLGSYCPSCGQDLSGLPPDDAGRRVCAECGAAWAGETVNPEH